MSTLTAHPQPAATRIPIGGGLWLDANGSGEPKIAIVSGATHLFEERGALASVASLAADFFTEHLS